MIQEKCMHGVGKPWLHEKCGGSNQDCSVGRPAAIKITILNVITPVSRGMTTLSSTTCSLMDERLKTSVTTEDRRR